MLRADPVWVVIRHLTSILEHFRKDPAVVVAADGRVFHRVVDEGFGAVLVFCEPSVVCERVGRSQDIGVVCPEIMLTSRLANRFMETLYKLEVITGGGTGILQNLPAHYWATLHRS